MELAAKVTKLGTKCWSRIAQEMGRGRIGKQCRERWCASIDPPCFALRNGQANPNFPPSARSLFPRAFQVQPPAPGHRKQAVVSVGEAVTCGHRYNAQVTTSPQEKSHKSLPHTY